jgi:membrane protein implicated in regulation of membrane protease activity
MTSMMSFDIRLPIGGLFTVLGLIIGGYGLATASNPAHYESSQGVNINLWWGLVMLLFGVLLLAAAGRSRRAATARESAAGAATEEREKRLGLERERKRE